MDKFNLQGTVKECDENGNSTIKYYNEYNVSGNKINQYGLDSRDITAKKDEDAEDYNSVMLHTGRGSDSKVIIGGGGHHKKTLKEGETVLYNKKSECKIKLDENGKVLISNSEANTSELIQSLISLVEKLATDVERMDKIFSTALLAFPATATAFITQIVAENADAISKVDIPDASSLDVPEIEDTNDFLEKLKVVNENKEAKTKLEEKDASGGLNAAERQKLDAFEELETGLETQKDLLDTKNKNVENTLKELNIPKLKISAPPYARTFGYDDDKTYLKEIEKNAQVLIDNG